MSRVIRLRTIVIYLTESEFDPSELLIHPFSHTIREAGELGGKPGHNLIRRAVMDLPQADDEEELELNYEENDNAMEVDTAKPAELASLTAESHLLRNPQRLSIQLGRHPSQPTPASKSKAATTAKHKKKQPKGP
eukprot:jgi/Tetstr1/430739/TSEL_000180.t1